MGTSVAGPALANLLFERACDANATHTRQHTLNCLPGYQQMYNDVEMPLLWTEATKAHLLHRSPMDRTCIMHRVNMHRAIWRDARCDSPLI
jgi:hypothetical protein